MTLKFLERMNRLLSDGSDPRNPALEPVAAELQDTMMQWVATMGQPGARVKDFLHGSWLGHALHPALILAPAGSWLTAAVLDFAGEKRGAQTAIGFGVLTALPAAASGLVDWGYTEGRARRMGLMHAALNSGALSMYLLSWLARRGGHQTVGVTFSTAGLATMTVAAYLGGEISYALGQGVNRNAWSPEVQDALDELDDFQAVADFDELREGRLHAAEMEIEGASIPLVMMRRGREVLTLNATCSHQGGPLAEGRLVDEWCVECPWHASRFDFRDGSVTDGPAAYPQPRFETRVRNGKVEVRAARPADDIVETILTSI
ncbi:MAG: Rieske 2Fe-2S domain-containing protein [Chloroflexota bacterium]